MKTKKILIIGEHHLNIKLFRNVMRAKGFETIEDRTGHNCTTYANLYKPELIILCSLLAYYSGDKISSILKNNEITSNIPILGVASSNIFEAKKMIDSGCFDCLESSFTLNRLLNAVKGVVEKDKIPSIRHNDSLGMNDHIMARLF